MSITEQNSPVNTWSLNVRRIGYMVLGAMLFGIVSYATNILQLSDISNVSFRPATAILLFFGAEFGPWVGLFTGCAGTFIGDYISGYGVFYNWDLSNALIVFIVCCIISLPID